MKYIIIALITLMAAISFASDITNADITKRIQQLESEKTKLEEIYKEISIRIDELKTLIAPKEPIEGKDVK